MWPFILSFPGGLPSEMSSSQLRDNDISPWWANVRQTLAQSTSTNRALFLAAVCRSVALEISTASNKVEVHTVKDLIFFSECVV